ncbi:MAG: hypothetical protein E7338_03120 [Clostridiales bacterium]|nr:hypothetical protein [Clostridiales bacterium]
MERKKLFNILSLVCNVIFLGLTIWAVSFYFYSDTGSGNMLAHGFTCFRFFTIDSNVLAAIASAIYIYFNIVRLTGKNIETPLWLKVFKYVATNTVAVTFFVVLLILVPMGYITYGYSMGYFYEYNCSVLHAITPILAMLTLAMFESEDRFDKKYTYFQFLPVAVYGIIYLICVVIVGVWPDFYGFTFDGRYYLSPIAVLLVFGVSYGAAELGYFLQGLCLKKLY